MDITFTIAQSRHLDDCKTALQNSELGRVYFPDDEKAARSLAAGISQGEIHIAINKEGIFLGFVWFTPNGAFHSFPYLHIIAVKEEYRSMGLGRRLLQYFEEISSEYASKAFLVVADFNPRAKQLYQSIGYKEIGILPNLYKAGVNECLMMKEF